MSGSEVKKCPKCSGAMIPRVLSTKEKVRLETDWRRKYIRLCVGGWALRERDVYWDQVIPFCCKECGYIELYKELKEKKG